MGALRLAYQENLTRFTEVSRLKICYVNPRFRAENKPVFRGVFARVQQNNGGPGDKDKQLPAGSGVLKYVPPVLIGLGQPLNFLKPVGALGSPTGSSLASYTLSKMFPNKIPVAIKGFKLPPRLLGTTTTGRVLGRFVPLVGWVWLIGDAVYYTHFDPALKGGQGLKNDIKNGVDTDLIKRRYSCFVKGTKVLMENGIKKNIEDVKIGDKILSVNMTNMAFEVDIVSDIPEVTKKYKVIRGEFENGTVNEFSPAHPYWVVGKGWCVFDIEEAKTELKFKVSQLVKGDVLLYYKDGKLKKTKVSLLKDTGKYIEMYNVEYVKKNNNFFANGILVHNKRINDNTDE